MRKAIILIIALFLLALPLAYPFTDYNNSLYNKTLLINPMGDDGGNWSTDNGTLRNYGNLVSGTIIYDNSTCISGTCINFTGTQYIRHPAVEQWAIGNGNFTVMALVKYANPGVSRYIVRRGPNSDASSYFWLVTEGCAYGCTTFSTPNAGVQGTIITAGEGWQILVGYYNSTGENRAGLYINSTPDGSGTGTSISQDNTRYVQISGRETSSMFIGQVAWVMWFNDTLSFDEIQFIENLTKAGGKLQPYPVSSAPDTTPPEIDINSYNMTSEGGEGCINWRTNKSNPCSTGDTTPTVNFATNDPAWCAIGTQNINFSDYNNLGVNRNCTIGQGTTSHTCTLVEQDELVYNTSYLYIGCEDTNKNQNLTSTSEALSLSVTGLEAARRNSIGIGIQNGLLSGYTNYTDLQIYARNLSNSQVKGTFDRAAKKGSKLWAFNGIGVADSHVNMFNLTPVLYTLEFANTTSSQITLQVELLINATK